MSWISDVKYELSNLDVSKKKLKQFGIVIGLIFGIILFWFYYPYPLTILGYFLLVISVLLFLGGIFLPLSLKKVYKVWMALAFLLGWIISRFLLTILFLVVLTPIAILGKIFNKKFLNTQFKDESSSFWIKKEKIKINYNKMF